MTSNPQSQIRNPQSLYRQVLIATALGALVGYLWPAAGVAMKPLGDAFVKLVRMIVAPIIFCTVVVGIEGGAGGRTVGKAGVLALIYFEIVTTLALMIGLIVVNVVRPGGGMNVDPASLDAQAVAQYVTAGRAQSVAGFLLDIIPTSVVDAFARGDILQVLLISVLVGFALRAGGGAAATVIDFVEKMSKILFGVIDLIMKAAPVGAFGAMAFTIGGFGVGALAQLAGLMACFYLTCAAFVAIVLGAIARWHGFGIWPFIKYVREEIFIVYGTSSSESVLLLLITSKGAAGVAGAALIALAGTLSATGYLPVAGVALILGIHRFMGEAMAVTNLIGNGVATIVVGKWCGQVDDDRLSVLDAADVRLKPDATPTPVAPAVRRTIP